MRRSTTMVTMVTGAALAAACDIEFCEYHHDCSEGTDICWTGECQPAFDRAWEIEIGAAQVDWTHPDGYAWDDDLSPPDLYTEFGVDMELCLTSYVPNTYDPVWYESCEFWVGHEPTVIADLWDVDGPVDEFATSYTWAGNGGFMDLAHSAGSEVGYVDSSGTVLLWLTAWPR